jgi:hypothetical protein
MVGVFTVITDDADTRRMEILAALAPHPAPEWFKHIPPPVPQEPSYEDCPEHLHSIINDWKDGGMEWDLECDAENPCDKALLIIHQSKYSDYWKLRRQWDKQDEESRFFQWCAYYAHRLIQELRR